MRAALLTPQLGALLVLGLILSVPSSGVNFGAAGVVSGQVLLVCGWIWPSITDRRADWLPGRSHVADGSRENGGGSNEPRRAGPAGMLALAVLVAPRLGLGDVKLVGLLSGYLGWVGWEEVVTGLAAGFLLGSVIALWAVVRGRGGWRTEIAFGPALMVGALAVAARHGPV